MTRAASFLMLLGSFSVWNLATVCLADDGMIIPLWQGEAPGSEGKTSEEKVVSQGTGTMLRRRVSNIHKPSLTAFLPAKDKATGAAMVICPGGAHRYLSIDHEGYEVARRLANIGVAGFVLKYRLANEEGSSYQVEEHALADARRAVRLVRSQAAEFGVDSRRVGLLGFSAGGELSILAGTKFETGRPDAADPIDRVDSRPDFLALIYPGYQRGAIVVPANTPPTFIAVADDDRNCAEVSLVFYQALRKAGVSGELHIYAAGGHGFGTADRPLPISGWLTRLGDWLGQRGYLKTVSAAR